MQIDDHSAQDLNAQGLRVGVVTAIFNESVTSGLKAGAIELLEEAEAEEILLLDVPGAFELPLIAKRLADLGYDAVVCLGAVIEGDTDHYEHVAHRASEGLMRIQLDTGIPVAFGILTTRNVESAIARSLPGPDNKGRQAAAAAVLAAQTLRQLPTV